MATPMTPDQMLAALKAEGLDIKEYPGWRDRCRCHDGSHERNEDRNSRGWGSVNGTVVHITAGNLGTRTVEQYIRDIINGDPNVPVKSQFVVAPSGDVWINSVGRCNHAGEVGSHVQDHLIAADFSTSDDYDNRWQGSGADGNSFTYGIENIAATSMTALQRTASVMICAAIARHYGWNGLESVGHGEISTQRGKADPNLHMGEFRADVNKRVTTQPEPNPEPGPAKVLIDSFFLNVAGNNAKGIETARTRAPKIAAGLNASHIDVAHFLECTVGSTMRPRLDSLLAGKYKRSGGGDGRYSYPAVDRGLVIIESGVITAASSTWYKRDDKQATYVIASKSGVRFMDVCMHLESDLGAEPDRKRIEQFDSMAAQALKKAATRLVPIENVLLMGDFNSENWVVNHAVTKGWRNVAKGTEWEDDDTFTGWTKSTSDDKRYDYALVRREAPHAEVVGIYPDITKSDHAGYRLRRELKP